MISLQLLETFGTRSDNPYLQGYWVRATKTEIPNPPKLPNVPHTATDAEKKELQELADDIKRLESWALDYDNNDVDVAAKTAEQMWKQVGTYLHKVKKIEVQRRHACSLIFCKGRKSSHK